MKIPEHNSPLKRIVLILLFGVAIGIADSSDAIAQTGKIAGKVTDAATGESIPGVNIVIERTTQGASTDADGRFVIIGVRPGTYTILVSFIGYARQRVTEVRVNLDLTTTMDFELTEEIIQGEEVIVVAKAVRVRKDVTSSDVRVDAETIARLPVTDLGQVLEIQAGVTVRNGIHIRGGRSSEVVYLIDGVPATDSFDGSTTVRLETAGVQELQVISGTYNAEFGNAMSGVINIVTKEGRSDRWGASAKLWTGGYMVGGSGGEDYLLGTNVAEFEEAGIQYRDVDAYSYLDHGVTDYQNVQGTIEGPLWGDRLTIFALGRYFANDGWLYGADIFNIDGSAGDSTLVPMNTYERLTWQGNIRFRASNKIILNLTGQGSNEESRPYSLFRRWSPDGRTNDFSDGLNLKLKMTHLISNTTFYTLNVATFEQKNSSRLYSSVSDGRYNDFDIAPPDTVEFTEGEFIDVLTGFGRYARGGTNLGRFKRKTRSYLVQGDLSSQVSRSHLLKTGFQFKVDNLELEQFNLIPGLDANGTQFDPFVPDIPIESSSAFVSFDNFNPITLSAYMQDKMEFETFIVNAGIRFDYFDARAQTPSDPSDPNIYNPQKKTNRYIDLNGDGVITSDEEIPENELTMEDREAYWWTSTTAKSQVSPRLGVAYPISEEGVIHFSFGIFFQIPTNNLLSQNFGFKLPTNPGSFGPFGNPDLDAQRTNMYEIGFKQGLSDFVVSATAYYRDVRSWVSTSAPILAALPGTNYVVFTNRDYANTRGIELGLERQFVDNWGFSMNYTFQVVEGSNSNPDEEFFASLSNAEPRLALLPLGWDQRHKFAGALFTGANTWGGAIRWRYEHGFPYTPTFASAAIVGSQVQPEFPTNSRRFTSSFEVDMNVYKEFTSRSVKFRLFAEIFNVFDSRVVTNVFSDTGEPDVTLDQKRTGSFDDGYWVRPDNYREPRRLQMGVEFVL